MAKRKPKRPTHLRDVPSGDLARVSVWVRSYGTKGTGRTVIVHEVVNGIECQVGRAWAGDLEVLEWKPTERTTDYEQAGEIDPLRG